MSKAKAGRQYVMDSFALLSYLDNERGADVVRKILAQGGNKAASIFMSVINFGECAYIIERERGIKAARMAIAGIGQLPITLVNAGQAETLAAAHIKANYKVSYADAFAIALAQSQQAAVVTGDPEFKAVEDLIDVLWLDRE